MKTALIGLLMLSAAMGLSGCSSNCDTTQNASGQKVVCNGRTFEYTLQGTPTGTTETYTWSNKMEKAQVSAVFQGTGNGKVTILDADGKQVYSKSHSGTGQSTGSTTTMEGKPGDWKIMVQVTALSGQVVFRVSPTG